MRKIAIVFGMVLSVFMIGCSGTRPTNIGINNGSLSPCPSKPNCITSQAADEEHFSESFQYSVDKSVALNILKKIILSQPRTKIVSETDNYLYAEYTTACFRFVDDVEFYFPENEQVVHFRSASRLGHSDLGVNKKRIESIRLLFTEMLNDK